MKLETVPRRKIRDEVAERIKEYIAAERLGLGDRLPTEGELAVRFGVSRLSVREATKALEFLGIVEAKTGVGLAVGQLDMARMADHLAFLPALQQAESQQLIDSRVIVETGVLARVAERMTQDPLIAESLKTIVEEFRTARTIQTWIDLDIRFHRTLLESSGLAPIVAFGDLLQVFFQRFRDSVKKAEWKAAIESHQFIIDRLQAGDVSAAASELREHIESHRQRIGAGR